MQPRSGSQICPRDVAKIADAPRSRIGSQECRSADLGPVTANSAGSSGLGKWSWVFGPWGLEKTELAVTAACHPEILGPGMVKTPLRQSTTVSHYRS
eukprot:scaffold24973_cov117-Isochrysis_galbana.AAC.1